MNSFLNIEHTPSIKVMTISCKQYVKKAVWYIGGEKRKQKGGALPLGLLASIGASILGEIAKPILGKFLW